jgi:hypothetical protein
MKKQLEMTNTTALDSSLPGTSSVTNRTEESANGDRPRGRDSRRPGATRRPGSRDEILDIDDRASLRPAQWVESKLTRLLEEATMPVSHLQMRGLLKVR